MGFDKRIYSLNFIPILFDLTEFSKELLPHKNVYICLRWQWQMLVDMKNIKGGLSLKDYFALEHLIKARMSVIIW